MMVKNYIRISFNFQNRNIDTSMNNYISDIKQI
jgi:hypothetical protein